MHRPVPLLNPPLLSPTPIHIKWEIEEDAFHSFLNISCSVFLSFLFSLPVLSFFVFLSFPSLPIISCLVFLFCLIFLSFLFNLPVLSVQSSCSFCSIFLFFLFNLPVLSVLSSCPFCSVFLSFPV